MRSFPLDRPQSNEHRQKIFKQRQQYQWPLARDSFRLIQVTEAISFIHGNQIYHSPNHFEWLQLHETQCKCIATTSWIFFSSPPLFSVINETSLYPPDNSYQVHRISRSQPITINAHSIQPASRPLSSADEGGPVPKKLRSTSRQPEALKSKPIKFSLDDPLKKARARPALSFANIFSFSGSQSTASSRANPPPGKNNIQPTAGVGTRRSTRLLSGTGTKTHSSKVIC